MATKIVILDGTPGKYTDIPIECEPGFGQSVMFGPGNTVQKTPIDATEKERASCPTYRQSSSWRS